MGLIAGLFETMSSDDRGRLPIWFCVFLCTFSGTLILLLSIVIRFVLRLSWFPQDGARAFLFGLVSVAVWLCNFLELGFVALVSAECVLVVSCPFWNRANPHSAQP